jgi:hypothetical protein
MEQEAKPREYTLRWGHEVNKFLSQPAPLCVRSTLQDLLLRMPSVHPLADEYDDQIQEQENKLKAPRLPGGRSRNVYLAEKQSADIVHMWSRWMS